MSRKCALFLMQDRGTALLEKVVAELGPDVIEFVVSAKDKAVKGDWYESIQEICRQHSIRFYDRSKQPEITSELQIAIGWRWLIAGAKQLIVMHDSLLPRFRGFNPVVTCLLENEPTLGATAFIASDKYDEGDVIASGSVAITYPITIKQALEMLVPVFAEVGTKVVADFLRDGKVQTTPQDHPKATFSLWRDENDYWMDWNRDSAYLRRFVDAVGEPYAGALTSAGDIKCRVIACEEYPDVIVHDRLAQIGKVIFVEGGKPVVVCGQGLLKILDLRNFGDGEAALPLKKFRTRFATPMHD